MTVVGKQILEKFIKKHTRAGTSLRPWLAEAECANWETTQDIKNRYNSADFLSNNRVVFNIGAISSDWWSSPPIPSGFLKSTGLELTRSMTNGTSSN
jgi:hypothetical protein